MTDFKIYLCVIALNVSLTALHKGLSWLAPRTKFILDDKLVKAISYLLTMLEWAMGSRGSVVMRNLNYAKVSIFVLIGIAIIFYLTGCAALPGFFDNLFGDKRSKATRVPLTVYRADLQIAVDGGLFDGIGVTLSKGSTTIDITSQIHIDRVEVETCSRQDVCQNGKPCSAVFNVDSGWWGSSGKHMTYEYTPSAVERTESCPIYFRVYDKAALAAWGYLAFRNGEELPATFTCNGIDWRFSGHSVCQTKSGLIQRISFAQDVEDYDADQGCNMKKIDKRTFELRPALGLCTGKFLANDKWHGMDVIAYDETLIRGI